MTRRVASTAQRSYNDLVAKRVGPGGELEQAVLAVVWERGTATIREIYERVGAPNGLVYTTVAKVVDRLVAKGLLARSAAGRAFTYRARIRRETVDRAQLTATLDRIFAVGDAAPAMATLVDAIEAVNPELLDELSKLVQARRKRRK